MKKQLLLFVMLLLPIVASAEAVEIDGIYYNLIAKGKIAEVTSNPYGYYSGSVVIPETVTYNGMEYSVTSIGDRAFFACTQIASISIPRSVTDIGNYVFYNCSSLTSVHITDIAAWCVKKINGVFSNPLDYAHKLYLNSVEIKDLVIPNNVTSIETSAFSGCSDLTSITIPNSVTIIGKSAFQDCTSLPSIIIPNSVTSIGNSAFYGCSNLTSVAIPNSIKNIESGTFSNCSSLTSITIPNSVTSIGNSAFQNCSNLASITIPNSVTTIGSEAFYACLNLKSITIPNSVTSIGSQVFRFCYGLTSITLSNNLTSIGWLTFEGCSLTSIIIPNSVKNIEASAFRGCSSLTSITIPNSVTTIGDRAFEGCSNITTIAFPDSVASIGAYALNGCTSLSSVSIPSSVTIIEEYAFSNCDKLSTVSLPEDLFIIKRNAFSGCSMLKSIVIPASVQYIYQETFNGCTSLESVRVLATTPPFTYDNTFSNYDITLLVPETSVDTYKTAEPWKNFKNIVKINKPEHTLTYIVGGEVYKQYQVEEGETITPETVPTKEGYSFSGWSGIPATMPANDVTVTGTFSINKYKLTYMVNGSGYKSSELEYGATITPEAVPAKEGYTFSGWSEIPTTMPANDVTVTGTFSINKYKLTYMVDGSEYKSSELEYGATITPEAVPTKEGYTFSGWSEIPTTMPAHDVIISGKFSTSANPSTLISDFEWLEENNKVEVVIGEPYQLKFSCSDNSLPFTSDYTDSWVHYDFAGGQHVVSSPTGYSIDDNGIITGLKAGSYAIKFTGWIQAKSGADKWLYITVVTERKEKESNNTLNTANYVTSKIRFGLYNTSDIDYFKYTNSDLKWGDKVTFKIHYYGTRENPFGYKWATFSGTSMSGGGSLISQDQECNALVTSGNTVYLEVYYDQSRSQYFNYGEEFEAEVYINGVPVGGVKKCATPTISYGNKKLLFDCDTEGVEYISEIKVADEGKYTDSEIPLSATYEISVYATKSGYENSDVATATLVWTSATFTETTPTTAIGMVKAAETVLPVLIQNNGGLLNIQGAADGTPVSVYTVNGTEAGSSVSNGGQAQVNTNLQPGTVAIVKIGEKSVKVVVK